MSGATRERVLLLVPTTTYRAHDFLEAARRLDVEVVVGTTEKQALEDLVPGSSVSVDPADPAAALERVRALHERFPLTAVVGADDETAVLAARVARGLGLPANPPEAVAPTRDKHALRQILEGAGLPTPAYRLVRRDEDLIRVAAELDYPCILKPTFLSASRGVLRADDPEAFVTAFRRIEGILDGTDVGKAGGQAAAAILVEEYIPGTEHAVEAILTGGDLQLLALFDKPDPMEGPTFEETIYVTPSRLPEPVQEAVVDTARRAVEAVGLAHGPVHAEVRVNDDGVWPLELAARAIGGLCPRALRFGTGRSLEELILLHATGHDPAGLVREERAAGVLMLPVPRAGVLREVAGVDDARAVPSIDEVTISIGRGERVEPLPAGDRYLGFVFARAASPGEVEVALREAWSRLDVRIDGGNGDATGPAAASPASPGARRAAPGAENPEAGSSSSRGPDPEAGSSSSGRPDPELAGDSGR